MKTQEQDLTEVELDVVPPALRESAWPAFVTQWPAARLGAEGLSGRILRGAQGWIIFMTAERDVHVPLHRHGAQWGIVLEGEMDLTIDGVTRTYRRGESHYIPAGVAHEATLFSGWQGLYVFDGPSAAPKVKERR